MDFLIKNGVRALIILGLLWFGLYRFQACTNDYAWQLPGYHSLVYTPSSYEKISTQIQKHQQRLQKRYPQATEPQQQRLVNNAQQYLEKHIQAKLFPFWYGTPYAFHGYTQVPGKDSIACGYFVTTVLHDAGFVLDRFKLARLPSEQMITSLIQDTYINRYSNASIQAFIASIRRQGEGLYIVGLDTHTGFLWNDGQEVYFIHSSGRAPRCVVRELATKAQVLSASGYRVVGKISDDEALFTRWLTGQSAELLENTQDSILQVQ